MDFYFTKYLKLEREYQQLVVRENNYSSISNGTDFFIIDIEYDCSAHARFDLIAIEWTSERTKRKLFGNYRPKIVIFEMKYGDGALKGNSGMQKHLVDFHTLISDTKKVGKFKDEMLCVFKQKRELGIIPCLSGVPKTNKNEVKEFEDEIEMVFLIANHDPDSTKLHAELSSIQGPDVKFITSNFMGYGLYRENVIDYADILLKVKSQNIN
jgi:hypothetical protein